MEIRKLVTYIDETFVEGGKAADRPLKIGCVAAVVKNPWAGAGFDEDLRPKIHEIAPKLGALLTDKIVGIFGDGDKIEAYGKAAVVGLDGEVEHASALIHTLRFGNYYREAVKAKSYLAFTNIRGAANTSIQVPLMHKHDEGQRSHYLTANFSIPDAPAADEIVIVLGAADGGRPHHRIGNRYEDLKELG